MKYETYIFNDNLDIRQNFFLTKVVQKYRFYKTLEKEQEPFVHFTVREIELLLGSVLYKKRLGELITKGFIKRFPIKKNIFGHQVYGLIPLVTTYKRIKMYNKVMASYYDRKKANLSKIARKVYVNICHAEFDLSNVNLDALSDSMWTRYSSIKKSGLKREEYDEYLQLTLERIVEYSSMNKTERVEHVSEDKFGNRLHSIFTSIPRELRQHIKLWGEDTTEIDLKQSQPTILATILEETIGENSFTNFIKSGNDVYSLLHENRNVGKKIMYNVLFGERTPKQIKKLFPDVWETINSLKWTKQPLNPSPKPYANLAYILQQRESKIFRILWDKLLKYRIAFVPIHDSIIIQNKHLTNAISIMNDTLSKHIIRVELGISMS